MRPAVVGAEEAVGTSVGEEVGLVVGDTVGLVEGETEGDDVGLVVGDTVGETVGAFEGADVGTNVGASENIKPSDVQEKVVEGYENCEFSLRRRRRTATVASHVSSLSDRLKGACNTRMGVWASDNQSMHTTS